MAFDPIQFDDSFLDELDALPEDIDEAIEDGLDASVTVYFDAKLERVDETYARPPDGWVQSGAWREGQRIETERGERRVVDTGRAAEPITNYEGGYAERLGELNTVRRNRAAENAVQDAEEDALEAFEAAVLKRLGL